METILANEDLKRHIFSFGSSTHRTHMKEIAVGLSVQLEPIVYGLNHHRGDRNILEYFRDEYTAQELIDYSRYVNRCKCCTRHSHHKPYLECVDGVQHVQIPVRPTHEEKDCECSCRHIARNMLKVYLYHHLEID